MSQPRTEPDQITFLIGGLGAGKTELALNLSLWHARRLGPGKAHLLDLDIVNPFFRVRQVKEDLDRAGVVLVMPDDRVLNGDLPALPARVWATFEQPGFPIVCDVGGGELGLRPLARLTGLAGKRPVQVLCVINPFRPGFLTTDQTLAAMKRYSDLSALTITHLVANPHLTDETTPDLFRAGLARVREAADRTGLPLAFAMVADRLAPAFGADLRPAAGAAGPGPAGEYAAIDSTTVFVIRRFWDQPWHLGLPKDSTEATSTVPAGA